MKKHNFSAGPCILPQDVFTEASQAVLELADSGLSILEISHRSEDFVAIIEEARALVLDQLNLTGKGYTTLFLQGGASMQFLMVAYNLLEKKAAYLNTGRWADKAIQEAKNFGEVYEVASSKAENFNYIPKTYSIPTDADYFHCTSNNTVAGTQMKTFPKTNLPFACDMSSDIFSRSLDFSQFDLIYAGAQKNLGPAGATLVVIKDEILGKVSRQIPSMMNYQLHIDKESMFNTPPVFSVYVSLLNLRWLKKRGGIKVLEEENIRKAQLLYDEIDRNPLFYGMVQTEDRSMMNATFNLNKQDLKSNFENLLKEAGINGVKGHRSIGGYRASMYNALAYESVAALVEVMQELEKCS